MNTTSASTCATEVKAKLNLVLTRREFDHVETLCADGYPQSEIIAIITRHRAWAIENKKIERNITDLSETEREEARRLFKSGQKESEITQKLLADRALADNNPAEGSEATTEARKTNTSSLKTP